MSTLTPHQSLALSTKGHLALTANAGSGKTFVLARKYLDALVKDKLDISSVAAITFTEKAASELYLKISILIDEKLKECKDLADKKQLEKVRRQLVSANISTIHSFCISTVSYTHLRAHETVLDLVCRLLLEKKKQNRKKKKKHTKKKQQKDMIPENETHVAQ